jgi:hypothetical protein
MTVIAATQKVEVGGWQSEASLSKSMRPYLKSKLKSKREGDMPQVVVFLPSKYEALSSIPTTTKNKKEFKCDHGDEIAKNSALPIAHIKQILVLSFF